MPPAETEFQIRSFRPEDAAACNKLYADGLLGGKLAGNDTGSDLQNIEQTYMRGRGSHFWVATIGEQVVGMIGVQQHEPGTGEVRRLRVATNARRRGIGSALVETALRFCSENNVLKITLDTFLERDPAIRLFEKFGFRHALTRTIDDRDLLYFYLDLYFQSGDRRKED